MTLTMIPKFDFPVPKLSTGYNVVRSLQLEGRLHVPAEGSWPITSLRVGKGWGWPDEADFPHYGNSFLFPPPEPSGLDQKAKKFRTAYYLRVYTPEQCRLFVEHWSPVQAAFEITEGWDDPPDGRIPPPQKGDKIVASHSVTIMGVDVDRQEFVFDAGWGHEWGEDGMGRLPFAYFEHRLIDAYSQEVKRPELHESRGQLRPVMNEFLWGQRIPGEGGCDVHVRELYDNSFDEYIGWAIVAERGEWLDVHELFVRPVVRRRGNGTNLMRLLRDLSEQRGKQLRFWVSFADIDTRAILAKMLRPLGYRLGPSPVRWAAYLGTRGKTKGTIFVPPPPDYIPLRPTAGTPPGVREGVAALTVAASLMAGVFSEPASPPMREVSVPVWEHPPTANESGGGSVPNEQGFTDELKPGTEEFDRKNSRRFELIEKRVDHGLSAQEEAEYQALQSEILAVTKKRFPRPPLDQGWLWGLKEGAGGKSESPE